MSDRGEIVEEHIGFVWHCARRLPETRELDHDDLAMCGVIGLLDAVDRFDPDRGYSFVAFAAPRIRGAMVDAGRQARWLPDSIQRRSSEARRVGDDMVQRLGRHPSRRELADELEVPLARLESWRHFGHLSDFASLDAPGVADSVGAHEEDPAEVVEKAVDLDQLPALIDELDPKARTVIRLYYFGELTMPEIGRLMGLTSTRVWQIRHKALEQMRARFEHPVAA